MPEARLHDEQVLPHQIRGDLEAMFPRAIAGEEEHEEPQARDLLEERGRIIGQRTIGHMVAGERNMFGIYWACGGWRVMFGVYWACGGWRSEHVRHLLGLRRLEIPVRCLSGLWRPQCRT